MKLLTIALFLCYAQAYSQTNKVTISVNPTQITTLEDTAKPKRIIICSPSKNTLIKPKPLIILNGFVLTDSAFSQINPTQIQSIEVLKGASAIAKFGSKGENGAILINAKPEAIDELTKKGIIKPVL